MRHAASNANTRQVEHPMRITLALTDSAINEPSSTH
jgi:hypothetical protein